MSAPSLEQRVLRLEAEAEIRNLMTLYGLAADCGDTEMAVACHTPDATYCVSDPTAGRTDGAAQDPSDLTLRGQEAIRQMLNSDLHQSLIPDCAHTSGPITLAQDGKIANAVGYSRLYRAETETTPLMRLAINHWRFEHHDGRWRIAHRTSRVLGERAAQHLLKEKLHSLWAGIGSITPDVDHR